MDVLSCNSIWVSPGFEGPGKKETLNVSKNAVKQYISPSRPNNLPRYLFYCDPKIKQDVSRTFTLSLPKSFQWFSLLSAIQFLWSSVSWFGIGSTKKSELLIFFILFTCPIDIVRRNTVFVTLVCQSANDESNNDRRAKVL